jgi:hypothetical protein
MFLVVSFNSYRRRNARTVAAIALLGAVNAECKSLRDDAGPEARDKFASDLSENARLPDSPLRYHERLARCFQLIHATPPNQKAG